MKYIKVPQPVKLVSLFGETFKNKDGSDAELSCQEFILQRLMDSKFGAGMESITSAFQIKQAVEESHDSDTIKLENKDWELLADVIKTPSQGNQYNTNLSHCLLKLMKAITNATDSTDSVCSESAESTN